MTFELDEATLKILDEAYHNGPLKPSEVAAMISQSCPNGIESLSFTTLTVIINRKIRALLPTSTHS